MLYHGTTWKFDSFDIGKSKELNFIGDGIYLTTSEEDAHKNYACVGPDLKNRIDLFVEDIDICNQDDCEPRTKEEIIYQAAHEMIGEHSLVLECELTEEAKVLVIDSTKPVYFDLYNSSFDGEDFTYEPSEAYNKITDVFEQLGVDYKDDDFDPEITALFLYNYCKKFFGDEDYQNLFAEIVCALGYDAVRFVNIGAFLYMYRKENHDHIIVFNKDCVRIVDVHDNEINTRLEFLKEQNVCASC
jgi:hypothetical protein